MSVPVNEAGIDQVMTALKCLSDKGVTSDDLQRIIDDPHFRQSAADALAKRKFSCIGDVIYREQRRTEEFCRLAESPYPGDYVVQEAMKAVVANRGSMSPNDYFIPGGIDLDPIFMAWTIWNIERRKFGQSEIVLPLLVESLCGLIKDATILTKTGSMWWDFSSIMRVTNVNGHPLGLGCAQQIAWALEQSPGCDGIMSLEEVAYLFTRGLLEYGVPPWGYGMIRCSNETKPGSTVSFGYTPGSGIGIDEVRRSESDPRLTVIPRIFTPLSSTD